MAMLGLRAPEAQRLLLNELYANPTPENHNGAGFGIVRFRKSTREIVLECWPRFVDVAAPDATQYLGWPLTFKQSDNYARKPIAMLPELQIEGADDPVVQIVDEYSGEVVYTLRINGQRYRPNVFRDGSYTIHISNDVVTKTLHGVESVLADATTAPILVKFE